MSYGEFTPLAPGDFEYGRLGLVDTGTQPILGLAKFPSWARIHSWVSYITTVNERPIAMEIIGIGLGKDATDDSELDLNDVLMIVPPDRTRRDGSSLKAWASVKGNKITGRVKEIVAYACPENYADTKSFIDDGVVLNHANIVTRIKGEIYGEREWKELDGNYLRLWNSVPDNGKYAYGIVDIKEYDSVDEKGERHYKLDPRTDASQVIFLPSSMFFDQDFILTTASSTFYYNRLNIPMLDNPIWGSATVLTDEQIKALSTNTGDVEFSIGNVYSIFQGGFIRFDFNNLSFLENLPAVSNVGELIWDLYVPIKYKLETTNMESAQAMLVVYCENQIKATINNKEVILSEPGWYPLFIPSATNINDYYLKSASSVYKEIQTRGLGAIVGESKTLHLGILMYGMANIGSASTTGDKILMESFVYSPGVAYETSGTSGIRMQGQTFTVPKDTYIESIKFLVRNKAGLLDADLFMNIYLTNDGLPTGTPVAAGVYTTLKKEDTDYTWYEVDEIKDYNSGDKYLLRAGITYAAVVWTGGTLVTAEVGGVSSNLYNNGTRVYKASNTWYADSSSDLIFKIYGLMETIKGYGIQFDPNTAQAYLTIPHNPSLKPALSEQLRISANVIWASMTGNHYIYESDGTFGKGFSIYSAGTTLLFYLHHSDSTSSHLEYDMTGMELGKLYNIEFRVLNTGLDNRIELYIDGVFVKSQNLSSLADISYSTNGGFIGNSYGADRLFHGRISDVQLWKGSTLISYWEMKEGTGFTIYDKMGTQNLTGHVTTPYAFWTRDVPWGEPRSMKLTVTEFAPWLRIYNKSVVKTRYKTISEKARYDYKESNFILSETPKKILGIYLVSRETGEKFGPNLLPALTRIDGPEFEIPLHNLYARVENKTIWKWRGFPNYKPGELGWPFIQVTYYAKVDNKMIPHSIDAGAYIRSVGYVWVEYITQTSDENLLPSPRSIFSPNQTILRFSTMDGSQSDLHVTCSSAAPDYTLNTFIPWGMKVDIEYNKLPPFTKPIMRNRAISGRIDQGICLHPNVDLNILVEADIVAGSDGKGEIKGLGSRQLTI